MKKKLLLCAVSLFLITGFFLLPQNREWLLSRPLSFYSDIPYQVRHWDLESRKLRRWGADYVYSKHIASFFDNKGIKKDVLVLLPPSAYFKAHGIAYHVPEPVVFYYFTGLKTIWGNSPEATKATWYVRTQNGKIIVDSVTSPRQLTDTITAFSQYKYAL